MWDHPEKIPTGNMLNIDLGMTGIPFLEITVFPNVTILIPFSLFVQGLFLHQLDVTFMIWEICVCLNANAQEYKM